MPATTEHNKKTTNVPKFDVAISAINSTISAFRNITLYGLGLNILFHTSTVLMLCILIVGITAAIITQIVLNSFDQYYKKLFNKLQKLEDPSFHPDDLNKLSKFNSQIDAHFEEESHWISMITFLFDLVMFIQLLTVALKYCGIIFVQQIYVSIGLLSIALCVILFKTVRQDQINKDYTMEKLIITNILSKNKYKTQNNKRSKPWINYINPIANLILTLAALTCMIAIKQHQIFELILLNINVVAPVVLILALGLITLSFFSRRFRYFAVALFFGTTAYYTILITFSSLITYYIALPSTLVMWISSTGFAEPIWVISLLLSSIITGFFIRSFFRNDDILSIAEYVIDSNKLHSKDLNANHISEEIHGKYNGQNPKNSSINHQPDEKIQAKHQ
ncbi:MAG: hypothetical protein ACON5A_04190 [Candidatus Comchoanobacterales bacterium]